MDFIISHRRDLDGISSAAILKRKLPEAKVFLVDYEDLPKTFKELTEQKDATIYVADLNLGVRERQCISYIKKISKTSKIHWFDHHIWHEDVLNRINEYVNLQVNHDKCATEVVFDFVGEGDSVSAKIANYARDQDFYTKNIEEANMISDIIAAQHKDMDFLLFLVDLLAGGIFWKPEFDQIRETYLIEKDKLLEVSIKNTSYYGRFAISYSDPLVPSGQVASNTVEKEEKDILILVYPSGRMSFRRKKDSDVNLNRLARVFGGGGHPYAAGANFGRQVTEKSIGLAKKEIADRVEQWLLKRS